MRPPERVRSASSAWVSAIGATRLTAYTCSSASIGCSASVGSGLGPRRLALLTSSCELATLGHGGGDGLAVSRVRDVAGQRRNRLGARVGQLAGCRGERGLGAGVHDEIPVSGGQGESDLPAEAA